MTRSPHPRDLSLPCPFCGTPLTLRYPVDFGLPRNTFLCGQCGHRAVMPWGARLVGLFAMLVTMISGFLVARGFGWMQQPAPNVLAFVASFLAITWGSMLVLRTVLRTSTTRLVRWR